ncbi:MAG: metal-binding protein [Cyclobacteriaceae bacterium]|nr:metal-binding protein [Cyclobacteriaceae bacterium]
MLFHSSMHTRLLYKALKQKEISFAGNKRLKIYGLLSCTSGKRMKRQNRVFFVSEKEAIKQGYRPCGQCLKKKYHAWIYLTRKQF